SRILIAEWNHVPNHPDIQRVPADQRGVHRNRQSKRFAQRSVTRIVLVKRDVGRCRHGLGFESSSLSTALIPSFAWVISYIACAMLSQVLLRSPFTYTSFTFLYWVLTSLPMSFTLICLSPR